MIVIQLLALVVATIVSAFAVQYVARSFFDSRLDYWRTLVALLVASALVYVLKLALTAIGAGGLNWISFLLGLAVTAVVVWVLLPLPGKGRMSLPQALVVALVHSLVVNVVLLGIGTLLALVAGA